MSKWNGDGPEGDWADAVYEAALTLLAEARERLEEDDPNHAQRLLDSTFDYCQQNGIGANEATLDAVYAAFSATIEVPRVKGARKWRVQKGARAAAKVDNAFRLIRAAQDVVAADWKRAKRPERVVS
jgi:hypothetical protein